MRSRLPFCDRGLWRTALRSPVLPESLGPAAPGNEEETLRFERRVSPGRALRLPHSACHASRSDAAIVGRTQGSRGIRATIRPAPGAGSQTDYWWATSGARIKGQM
ncbi:hypothetical protein NDU88_000170 [Pleurodeles waltl]|uniref:Uncharacterized protein n=1 Tax=Pleurodeles waltl TaxID=8319 RepID=A0AAV7KMK2_PLEWA|nr:hypothetical protein NDU88_000170 [Pleurodeles waltl]